jgi:hypothetical protein
VPISSTIELYEQSREGSADSRVGTMTRRFLVPATRETALATPGVPTVGSTYIFNGRTLRCDRLDVSGTDDPTISEVVAAYSSDGRFSFTPRVDRTEGDYARWSLSTTLQTRKVPSFVMRTVYGQDNVGEQVWERDDIQIEVPITTFSSTIVLSAYSNSTMNKILDQVGRIHEFGSYVGDNGSWYRAFWRFKGHRASRIAEDRFEVTYDWYNDPGNNGFPVTQGPVNPPPDGDIGLIGNYRLVSTATRYSFEEYLIIPPQDLDQSPGIITYDPFVSIKTDQLLKSWKSLPGDPIGGNP